MDAFEREVATQRAWIGRCDDPRALLDRMAAYREDIRAGTAKGNLRLQRAATELLELAEDRVVELKAARIHHNHAPTTRPASMEQARLEQEQRAKAERAEQDRRAAAEAESRRRAEEEAAREQERRSDALERLAAARLANAQAAELEARTALLRAQAVVPTKRETLIEKAANGRPPGVTPGRPGSGAMPQSVVAPAPGTVRVYSRDSMLEADRQALAGAGRWPPPAVSPRGPMRAPDADWPVEWTLTGGDLAKFRRKQALAPASVAARLGVPVDEILRAEARPEAKVRPALQAALREAIRRAEVEARRQQAMEASRDARGEAGGEAGSEAGINWEAIGEKKEAGTPELAEATARGRADSAADAEGHARRSEIVEGRGPMLTGADLGRWRAAAGLTQRQAAETLGVAHGTVAKAELAPQKELGEQLGAALSLSLTPKPGTR